MKITTFQGYDYTGCRRYTQHGDFFYRLAQHGGTWWVIKGKMSTMKYVGGVDTTLATADYSLISLCANDTHVWVLFNEPTDGRPFVYCCTTAMVTTGTVAFMALYNSNFLPYISCSDTHAYICLEDIWTFGVKPKVIQIDATPAQTAEWQNPNYLYSVGFYARADDVLFYGYWLSNEYYLVRLENMVPTAEVASSTWGLFATDDYVYHFNSSGHILYRLDATTLASINSYTFLGSFLMSEWIYGDGTYIYTRQKSNDGWYYGNVYQFNPDLTLHTRYQKFFPHNATEFGFSIADGNYYTAAPSGYSQDGINYGGGWWRYGLASDTNEHGLLLGPPSVQSNAVWYMGI